MKGAPRSLMVMVVAATLVACSDHPAATGLISGPRTAAQAVSRTHAEFDVRVDAFFYLSCLDELTHWVGAGHVTVDVLQTPTGNTSTRVQGRSERADFYVVRANGVRYDMIGQGSTQVHEFAGPVQLLNIAEPKVFKSSDGDVLVTSYHLMIRFDDQGNPISVTANGACP